MLPTTTSTLNNLLAMSQIEELVDELLDQEFSEAFRILFQVLPAIRIPVDRKSLK